MLPAQSGKEKHTQMLSSQKVNEICICRWLRANCSTVPSENLSDKSSGSNEKGKTYEKDITKPDGDACNEDGTLKDASELEWPDSPTAPIAFGFQDGYDSDSGLEDNNASRASIVSNWRPSLS
jgi:hypothetical protein